MRYLHGFVVADYDAFACNDAQYLISYRDPLDSVCEGCFVLTFSTLLLTLFNWRSKAVHGQLIGIVPNCQKG